MIFSYDGKEIGTYQGDAMRNITSSFFAYGYKDYYGTGIFNAKDKNMTGSLNIAGSDFGDISYELDTSRPQAGLPTTYENRPASISALACITY